MYARKREHYIDLACACVTASVRVCAAKRLTLDCGQPLGSVTSYTKVSKNFQRKNLQNRFSLYKRFKKWSVKKTTLRRFLPFSRKSSRIFAEKKAFMTTEKRPFCFQEKKFIFSEKCCFVSQEIGFFGSLE
jgi:hypothetical protein